MPPADLAPRSLPLALVEEGERVMRICNACRYCEGFCAVFPAVERRLDFSEPDLGYLANLCHGCGECYYSCQYAPPHELHVNVARTLADIRRETYRKYAWPGAGAHLFSRDGLMFFVAAVLIPSLFVLSLRLLVGDDLASAHSVASGSFYRVMSHATMVFVFGVAAISVAAALAAGVLRFWRDMGESLRTFFMPSALRRAVADTASLRYLEGNGDGCAYPADVPSQARRRFHHATFYGFMLCFAATCVAAFYDNVLGWRAPYPFLSLPVVLGSAGGIGLLVGPPGLLWLKTVRNPELDRLDQVRMDVVFTVMLFLTSLTGFMLLAFRESSTMGLLLGLHLGFVLGLFVTMPYGKFVHGVYRFAALVRNAVEEGRVGQVGLEGREGL